MKKEMFVVIIVLLSICQFAMPTINSDAPNPKRILLTGHLYQNGKAVTGLNVYAKNMRTNKIIQNEVNVSDLGSYKISLEKIEGGLVGGDSIKVYAHRTLNNFTYYIEATFILAYDVISNGGTITKDLTFTNEGSGNIPGSVVYPDGRTNSFFRVYGTVRDSEGNCTNASTVKIKNMVTEKEKTITTNEKGNYSWDIGQLTGGWKVGDRISVNATYKSGYEKEYGKAPTFYIYAEIYEKERNIDMIVVGDGSENATEGIPKTYDGLLELFYIYWRNLNSTRTQNKVYEDIIDQLTISMYELENNTYTQEEVDVLISDALRECNAGKGDNTLTIILVIIIIVLILYLLYDKGILPIGKNKHMEEIRNNVTPIKKRYK